MQVSNLSIAIVGASLGGLSAANVLHRLGAHVTVFEAYPEDFHDRGGGLGGIDIQLFAAVRGSAEASLPRRDGGYFYGDLWRYLYEGLPEGTVRFGHSVSTDDVEVSLDDAGVTIRGTTITTPAGAHGPRYDFVVAADGGQSQLRALVDADAVPVFGGYMLWRGLVKEQDVPREWRGAGQIMGQIAQSNHEFGGVFDTGGYPIPCGNGSPDRCLNVGVYCAHSEAEVYALGLTRSRRNRQIADDDSTTTRSRSNDTRSPGGAGTAPRWFLPFVKEAFGPSVHRFWQAIAEKGKINPHPIYELAVDRAVSTDGRIILLGDAAHLGSSRTGAGAYTAMVDALELGRALTGGADTIDDALGVYGEGCVRRGQDLVATSVRRGKPYRHDPDFGSISPIEFMQRKGLLLEMEGCVAGALRAVGGEADGGEEQKTGRGREK